MRLDQIVYNPNPTCTHPRARQTTVYLPTLNPMGMVARVHCVCGEIVSVRWLPPQPPQIGRW